MTMNTETGTNCRLATISMMVSMPEYRGVFSPASLRHLVFSARDRQNSRGESIPGNGLNRAIIRIGRRILFDLDEFDAWIDSHREAP